MQNLSPLGRNAVSDMSSRYNISAEAVEHMLIAVNNGSGQMAQFNCPELGGSGQWMRGGMTMVGDMFNYGLKSTVDNLCNELSNLLASTQVFPEVPVGTPGSRQWWPAGLDTPISNGSQNNSRYAVFDGRLAVEVNGKVTVYDTLDHRIAGISQQQGSDTSLTFNSQYGTLQVSSLPVVTDAGAGNSSPPDTNFASDQGYSTTDNTATPDPIVPKPMEAAAPLQVSQDIASAPDVNAVPAKKSNSGSDIIALIEKLAHLHSAEVLSDEEFSTKKRELLARL